MVLLLQNNIIELYNLDLSAQVTQAVRVSRITIGGHRSDVRTLAFSSDNIAILSAAAESVKIWNRYAVWLCQSPRVEGCLLRKAVIRKRGQWNEIKQ